MDSEHFQRQKREEYASDKRKNTEKVRNMRMMRQTSLTLPGWDLIPRQLPLP